MSAQSPTLQRGPYLGLTGGVGSVWIVGQHNYGVPNFSGVSHTAYMAGKQLDFVYLRMPLTYRRIIGIENGDRDIGDSKLFWGTGIEIGALYDVELEYSINGEPNDKFVFDKAFNPNIEIDVGPARDLVLFNAMDVALTGSFGWERFLTQHVVFQAELKSSVSILDINDVGWQIKNEAGKYTSSRHAMLHLKCSLIYYVNKVKRMDIY